MSRRSTRSTNGVPPSGNHRGGGGSDSGASSLSRGNRMHFANSRMPRTRSGRASSAPSAIIPTVPENDVLNAMTPPNLVGQQAQNVVAKSTGTTTKSMSASTTCRGDESWGTWRGRERVDLCDTNIQTFLNELKLPERIMDEDIQGLLEELINDPKEVKDFMEWRGELKTDQFEKGDKYSFKPWLSSIVQSWISHKMQCTEKETEAGCRKGIDNLIELAFQVRNGAQDVWRAEKDLALPGKPTRVKADAITTMGLPEVQKETLKDIDNQHIFSWSYQHHLLSTVNFICEDKRYSAQGTEAETVKRQMAMGLYSAQKHRKALAFNDCQIFGATLFEGQLIFYVSFWKGKDLQISATHRGYRLLQFSEFLQSYFCLCEIAEHQVNFLRSEYERWTRESDRQLDQWRTSALAPWREKQVKKGDKKFKQDDKQNATESDAGSKKGGPPDSTGGGDSPDKGEGGGSPGSRDRESPDKDGDDQAGPEEDGGDPPGANDADKDGSSGEQSANDEDIGLSEDELEDEEDWEEDDEPVDDTKLRQIIQSVQLGKLSLVEDLPLTFEHLRAFSIITDAQKTESVHNVRSPLTWSTETEEFQGEFEDPAPFQPDSPLHPQIEQTISVATASAFCVF